ncbi:hypothetical protein [Mesorhizobium sp.]|uniref:hypothetical protein n=1 Tax=Mesorhizobium sp. TaxID=1871066 RepID=UPI003BADB48E
MVRDEIRTKSPDRKKRWKAKRQMSVDMFISLVDDKPITAIKRDNARAVHKCWLHRIAPEEGKADRSVSTGNRNMGNLRSDFCRYCKAGLPVNSALASASTKFSGMRWVI